MALLRVLSLRDLLLQHLLLEHEVTHAPQGGLHPDLKKSLRQLAADYEVQIPGGQPGDAGRPAGTWQLFIKPEGDQNTQPLMAVTGVYTSRVGKQSASFKALSTRLLAPLSEVPGSTAHHAWRTLDFLSRPASVIGILQECEIAQP